jgi:hypothetical protein
VSEDAVVCPQCRAELIASARAALSVLADDQANASERSVAGDVLSEAADTLRLPTSGRAAQ